MLEAKRSQRGTFRPPVGVAVLVFILLAASGAWTQDGTNAGFELLENIVTAHEPVYLKLSVHNRLAERIHFDLGLDRERTVEVVVTDPKGSKIEAILPEEGGVHRAGIVVVQPGEDYSQTFLLNQRYQFDNQGDYKVQVTLRGGIWTESGKPVPVASSVLALSVAPRDPKRLENVCDRLAKASSGYSNYQALQDAAVSLSYIQDPVAVPYLAKVLSYHNSVSQYAVQGLVRIGSADALQVLKSNLITADSLLRMQIQEGIQEIETGVHFQHMD